MKKFLSLALSISLLGVPIVAQAKPEPKPDEFALTIEAPTPIKFSTLSKMIGAIYPINMYTSAEVIINFAEAAQIISYSPSVNGLISLEWVKLPSSSETSSKTNADTEEKVKPRLANRGIRIVSGKAIGNSSFWVSIDKGGKPEIINFAVKVGPTKDRTVRVTVLPDPPVQPLKPLLDASKVDAVQAETIKVVAANRKIAELEQVIKDQDLKLATMKPINPEEEAALAAREKELAESKETIVSLTNQLKSERNTVTELKKLNAQYQATAQEQAQNLRMLNERLANIEANSKTNVASEEQAQRIAVLEKENREIRSAMEKKPAPPLLRPDLTTLTIPKRTKITLNGLPVLRRKLPPAPASSTQTVTATAQLVSSETQHQRDLKKSLARYQIPLRDGQQIRADALLEAEDEIWYWDGGRTRQKMAAFIRSLTYSQETDNGKAVSRAMSDSRLSEKLLKVIANKAASLIAQNK
jgi:hypothetical protein